MKTQRFLLTILIVVCTALVAAAQTKPLLKRTTYKTDRLDFGVGGTVAIVGAPNGSIRVEGWPNREIEITAEVEVQAETEADLVKLSQVTSFVTEESLGRVAIISVGANDKKYLKGAGKKLAKLLQSMPFKIDYVVKVPRYSDLQIDGGKGDLSVSGVDGTMKLNFLETNADLSLVGGSTAATFGSGTINVTIPTSNWRAGITNVQLANGTMNVSLPQNLNAEVDATILRTGKIENGFSAFRPRMRKVEFTDKSVAAKSGVGGVSLKFEVGDGTLKIAETGKPS
jgi:hypothetical protein